MKRVVIASIAAGALGAASSYAGIFQDAYRGLQLIGTPSGTPIIPTADGSRVNGQRIGRVRIVPDDLGQGHTLEFNRNFGPDSAGRAEVFDLGPVDLELEGATAMTAGFTRRGFLIGTMDFTANSLDYLLRAKTGAQNAELTGTIDASGRIEINQFGFYDATMLVTNANSQLTVNGVLADDFSETNLGIGPINVQGNIFVDLLAAGLAQAGVDTTLLETLFPNSAIDQITNAIDLARPLDAAEAAGLLDGGVAQPRFADALGIELPSSLDAAVGSVPSGGTGALPEPSTLALLLFGAGTLLRRR